MPEVETRIVSPPRPNILLANIPKSLYLYQEFDFMAIHYVLGGS